MLKLGFAYVDSLNVFCKLNRPMDLDLLVCSNNVRHHLFSFRPFKCSFQLIIRKFIEDIIDKSKSANGCCWTGRIHICDCTSIADMRFQQKIGLPIPCTNSYSFGIVGEVHCAILNSFEVASVLMHFIKHSVLPFVTTAYATLSCVRNLKSISVVSIFDKMLKVIVGSHMNDNGSIIGNIVMQILKILLSVSQLSYFCQHLWLIFEVNRLKFQVHV